MNWLRALPPVAVLALAFGLAWWLFHTKPEPRKWPDRETVPDVEVMELQPVDYQVWLKSQGVVEARTQSALIPEVSGRVVEVAPSFRAGGFFEEGEVLLRIDPRNYEAEVVVAESALAQAELQLAEEQAAAEQAVADWKRLQPEELPSDLVRREPQLRQARAAVAAAKARLETARANLERAKIRAPYDGRVLSKNVDVGQYVSPGSTLAEIYAVDYAEIRLPLSERQLAFIDLPEAYRGETPSVPDGPLVDIELEQGRERHRWQGRIVRAEGAIDSESRQLFVVAQIDDPYGRREPGRPPLKVGSFVQARIQGRLLEDRFLIPRELHRRNEYVVVVGDDNRIERRAIDPEWSDETHLVVAEGLRPGERLVLTHLNFPVDGMKVAIDGEEPAKPSARAAFARLDLERMPEELRAKLREARGDREKMRALLPELKPYRKTAQPEPDGASES